MSLTWLLGTSPFGWLDGVALFPAMMVGFGNDGFDRFNDKNERLLAPGKAKSKGDKEGGGKFGVSHLDGRIDLKV